MNQMVSRPILLFVVALAWSGQLVGAGGCATGNDPCAPNPCVNPPVDSCAAGVAQIYPATGQCLSNADVAECTYEPATVDCAQIGQYCLEGQCLADPCDPNPCVAAPADACEGNMAVSYEDVGDCETADGNVECTYAEASRTDCEQSGEICELGVCVASVEPCNPNPCTTPPDDSCTGEVASVYPAVGTCTESGGTAQCDYVAVELDCSANGLLCDAGQCVPDPCDPNPCTTPPADTCSGDLANSYPATGTCVVQGGAPDCTYTPTQVDCAASSLVCSGGLCVNPSDPCNPNPCTNPPADACSGDVALSYSSPGTCTDQGGSASCDYPPATEDCTLSGQVCSGGACVPAGGGGVFISEYVEGSGLNKYLEIYNGSSSPVDLSTFTVEVYFNSSTTVGATLALDPYVLLPGEVYVIADDGHTLWTTPGPNQVFSASLWNGNDAIRLMDGTTELDIMGVIGDGVTYWGQDKTLVRGPGIITGGAWDLAQWTELPVDTHQLGSHSP